MTMPLKDLVIESVREVLKAFEEVASGGNEIDREEDSAKLGNPDLFFDTGWNAEAIDLSIAL